MIKHFCDKCGTELNKKMIGVKIRPNEYTFIEGAKDVCSYLYTERYKEYCPVCYDEFLAYIGEEPGGGVKP